MASGRKPRAWTDEELTILKSYPQFSTIQIAEKIGVTSNTVRRKLKQLGIERRVYKTARDWTPEELELCKQYPEKSVETLAGLIGIANRTMRRKLAALGIQVIRHRNATVPQDGDG